MISEKIANPLQKTSYKSPLGELTLLFLNDALIKLSFACEDNIKQSKSPIIQNVTNQLDKYFNKNQGIFSVRYRLEGTDIQVKVWEALLQIPSGQTTSYSDFAASLELSNAVRAVANAIGKNPIPILIPCHRVVGKDGKLTGYVGGLDRKRWLLDFESGQQSFF